MVHHSTKRRVLVTGASGLVGLALCKRLIQDGWEVVATGRKSPESFRAHFSLPCDYFVWSDPANTPPPAEALQVDAIFHLMGEPIADHRWTAATKKSLVGSRVASTHQLVTALNNGSKSVRTLITASASGFYGDQGDRTLEENLPPGQGFLPTLCSEWEAESKKAHCRNIQMRITVVLSEKGGALEKMLPVFKAHLGGRLGNGQQWMSWIHVDDLVGALLHALNHPEVQGPVNAVAPYPVRNIEFTQALAKALGVSALFAVPAAALRLALGERALILLESQRMAPQALLNSGFTFQHPTIQNALNLIFGNRAE